jgi:hypothetical protein
VARAVKRLHIDASCIIYLTEGTSAFTSPMRARMVRCTEIAVEVIKPATSD